MKSGNIPQKTETASQKKKITLARLGWSATKTSAGLLPGGSFVADVIETAVDHIKNIETIERKKDSQISLKIFFMVMTSKKLINS